MSTMKFIIWELEQPQALPKLVAKNRNRRETLSQWWQKIVEF